MVFSFQKDQKTCSSCTGFGHTSAKRLALYSPAESSLSDDEDEDENENEAHPSFAFPELDTQIRECIKAYEAISQRDNNYYKFLNEPTTKDSIARVVLEYWEKNIRDSKHWETHPDYVFDFFLTRDLSRGHIIDFNPYAPRTDPLLFTYEELVDLMITREDASTTNSSNKSSTHLPEFRVIDSRAHPAASSNAPTYQHNMVPIEALSLSSGRDIEQFAELWKSEIQESMSDRSH
ncbi:hypothetical protein H0H87_005545 [Tephrocybe sp. NHM501043]|nr:hypothetical protein H0H87_005545 [Tephrocybe sp. NHM501043]